MKSVYPIYFYLFVFFLSVSIPIHSQTDYPKGCYMTMWELSSKVPVMDYEVYARRRSGFSRAMNGGNEFKLFSSDGRTTSRILRKKVLAYSDGYFLYLNGRIFKLQQWYCKVVDEGYYLAFQGCLDNSTYNSAVIASSLFGGLIGGVIVSAILATNSNVYVLNLEQGAVKHVDKLNLLLTLENYPDLLDQYEGEKRKRSDEILMKYVLLLNQRKTAEALNSEHNDSLEEED